MLHAPGAEYRNGKHCSQPFPKNRWSSARRHPPATPLPWVECLCPSYSPRLPLTDPTCSRKIHFQGHSGATAPSPLPTHCVPSLGQQHPCGKLYLGFTFRRNHPSGFSEDSQHGSCCLPYPPVEKAMLLPLCVSAGHPGTRETRWLMPRPSHATETSPTTSPGGRDSQVLALSLLTPPIFPSPSMTETSPNSDCLTSQLVGAMSWLLPTGQVLPSGCQCPPAIPVPVPPRLHYIMLRHPSEL